MTRKSVAEVFQLPPQILQGFAPVLSYNPLSRVVAKNKCPKLVIGYDFCGEGRVGKDVARCDSMCVHANVTVVPDIGQAPICAAHGAACAVDEIRDRQFQRVNPHLAAEFDEVFGVLSDLSKIEILAHPHLRRCVEGVVVDESWRFCDNFFVIDLRSDRQVAGALDVIEKWRKYPPAYALFARQGNNCMDLVHAVVDGAKVRKPVWWGHISYPALYAQIIDNQCGRRLVRDGDWLYQPRPVTAEMHNLAMENCGWVQNHVRPPLECDTGRLALMIPQGSG